MLGREFCEEAIPAWLPRHRPPQADGAVAPRLTPSGKLGQTWIGASSSWQSGDNSGEEPSSAAAAGIDRLPEGSVL